jgi:hypothetical protein
MINSLHIMEEQWDYCIILDACRYDYFEAVHNEYFEGILERRTSLATDTIGWCKNSFKTYHPGVIYVSANPYVNSWKPILGFSARSHFYRVIDVWDRGWDEKLGTVPPWVVNETALNVIPHHKGRRFIIHYLQPHAPYIGSRFSGVGFPTPNLDKGLERSD